VFAVFVMNEDSWLLENLQLFSFMST